MFVFWQSDTFENFFYINKLFVWYQQVFCLKHFLIEVSGPHANNKWIKNILYDANQW